MKCETCGKEHNGKYGSGRFCSQICARSFSSKHVTKEGRDRQRAVLNDKNNRAKVREIKLSNSKNYELDNNGNWVKIPKSKQKKNIYNDGTANKKFIDTKDRHRKSTALGKSGELYTTKKFIDHGYNVYLPVIDNGVDMIVEKDDGLKKVQVKSATSNDDNCTQFTLKSSALYLTDDGLKLYNKKYKKKDVDYFALYSEQDQDVYLIENDGKRGSFTIRTKLSEDNLTTKGKNLEKLHMAEDYQIDRVLDDIDKGIDRRNIIEVTDFSDNSDI